MPHCCDRLIVDVWLHAFHAKLSEHFPHARGVRLVLHATV